VGEAEEGQEAVTLATKLHPDVVILDVHMRGLGGIEAARKLTATEPSAKVVMLSLQDDSRTRDEAIASGASAVVGKQEGIARLFEVIRSVAGRAHAS
jgi:DNA-binding NarL/FixJ family response regulator